MLVVNVIKIWLLVNFCKFEVLNISLKYKLIHVVFFPNFLCTKSHEVLIQTSSSIHVLVGGQVEQYHLRRHTWTGQGNCCQHRVGSQRVGQ